MRNIHMPQPPQKPSIWDMNILGYAVFFGIPLIALIAAFHGWKPGWWIAGCIWLIFLIIAAFVRNDTR